MRRPGQQQRLTTTSSCSSCSCSALQEPRQTRHQAGREGGGCGSGAARHDEGRREAALGSPWTLQQPGELVGDLQQQRKVLKYFPEDWKLEITRRC